LDVRHLHNPTEDALKKGTKYVAKIPNPIFRSAKSVCLFQSYPLERGTLG